MGRIQNSDSEAFSGNDVMSEKMLVMGNGSAVIEKHLVGNPRLRECYFTSPRNFCSVISLKKICLVHFGAMNLFIGGPNIS